MQSITSAAVPSVGASQPSDGGVFCLSSGWDSCIFVDGAWFGWNDHRAVQQTIYQQVAPHTKDAFGRLQPDYIKEHLNTLKAFINTGVTVSVMRDSNGDTTRYFQARPGVSLFNPRYSSGKYAISVLQ